MGDITFCSVIIHRNSGAFPREWIVREIIFIFVGEEDSLELIEVERAISCFVVLLDHFVDLPAGNLTAELLHGEHDILLGDLA